MAGMNRKPLTTCLLALTTSVVGCGPGTGYIVKPVPLDERLKETVVASDGGWISAKLAVIDVDGLLMNRRGGFLVAGENPVSLFVEKFDKAQADPAVKAVVIRINSPGGGVTASDIMHRRLKAFREARPKVPVIAVIEDVGASGAYYVACGADRIFAHPTSVVGSIGVIVQMVSFAGTMDKLGITAQAVTSGNFKDMGSPLKPLDKEDRAIIQELVDDYYQRFLGVVTAGRPKLPADRVKTLADGRVYSATRAKELGLVDDLGYMDDAMTAAKAAAGTPRVKVVMYHRPWGYRANVYASGEGASASGLRLPLSGLSPAALLDAARPRFLYLWTGRN